MKKFLTKIVAAVLVVCSVFTATGCAKQNVVQDGKTVNVKVFKAGYGTTWLYRLKEKFEEVYKEQGYKINILEPDNSLKATAALSEMRAGKKSGVDLYFVQSVTVEQALDAEYGACAEDLTDVYDSPAISFDGSEESVKISSKLSSSYDGAVKDGDKYYSYLWASSPCGLVVNTRVLKKYGLSVPKTTNELFACYDAIYRGNGKTEGSEKTNVYPFSWAGNNAYGYALFPLYAYLGQILGREKYNKFISLQSGETPTEQDVQEGYKYFYNTDGGYSDNVYLAAETLMKQYNNNTSCYGSVGAEHGEAHYNLLMGNCAFIADGEFFFAEARVNYAKYVGDVAFINSPVNSAVGTILKLDGSGENAELCDKILSYVIGLSDEGKEVSEIISSVLSEFGVTLTEEQVKRVEEARAVFYERADHNAYIVKDSPVADIAKLFLRMAASDDFGKLFKETAYGYSPYASSSAEKSEYDFVNQVYAVAERKGAWGVSNTNITGLRKKANFGIYEPYGVEIVLDISGGTYTYASDPSVNNGDNEYTAFVKKVKTKVKEIWKEKVK